MIDTYDLLWSLQIAGRLICDDVTDPNEVGTGARAFMLRATDAKTVQDLAIRLAASSDAAADLILERLPVKKGGAT